MIWGDLRTELICERLIGPTFRNMSEITEFSCFGYRGERWGWSLVWLHLELLKLIWQRKLHPPQEDLERNLRPSLQTGPRVPELKTQNKYPQADENRFIVHCVRLRQWNQTDPAQNTCCYTTLLFWDCSSASLSSETGHQTLPLDSHSCTAFHPRIGNSSHAAITAFLLRCSDEALTAPVWWSQTRRNPICVNNHFPAVLIQFIVRFTSICLYISIYYIYKLCIIVLLIFKYFIKRTKNEVQCQEWSRNHFWKDAASGVRKTLPREHPSLP